MNHQSGVLAPRFLAILLVVLFALLLLTAFLAHVHPGAMPSFVQSTEGILD